MIDNQAWQDVKRALPFGVCVEATVLRHLPFGFFVEISGFHEVTAVVDAISFLCDGQIADRSDWPAIGEVVQGVVVDHVEHNYEIKLRVG